MSVPMRLSSYLDQHGMRYELCAHEYSRSSAETARTARVPRRQLAKSVILEDDDGCVMAVVPSDQYVMIGEFGRMLGRRHLRLADEARVASIFDDCDRGAIPPVGMAWGIETVVDEDVEDNEVVYMEGGDHEMLLRMSHEQFHRLMSPVRHGHFCRPQMHH